MYSKRLSSIILALLLVPSLALASEDVNYGVVNALLLDVQDASHQALWDVFVDVAGREFINEHVNQFRIIDPENDEYLAYVQQDGWDVTKWAFAVDADQLEAVSEYEFLETIIHEYTHILTLNTQEFDLDIRLFEGNEQYDQQAQAACNSYFNGEGCAKSGSYMDTFYQSFWTDIIDAHTLINPEDYDQLADFAQEYPGQFITWYAPTNAEEDIAESFARTGFARFINSRTGRVVRLIGGIALMSLGYLLDSTTGIVLMVAGLVPLAAGAFNWCVISALLGGPLRAERMIRPE